MDSPNDKSPFSAAVHSPGAQTLDSASLLNLPETAHPVRTDRLYQIAALAVGLVLLATVL